MTRSSLSWVKTTSSSMKSAPEYSAASKDWIVFYGNRPAHPRWAIFNGRFGFFAYGAFVVNEAFNWVWSSLVSLLANVSIVIIIFLDTSIINEKELKNIKLMDHVDNALFFISSVLSNDFHSFTYLLKMEWVLLIFMGEDTSYSLILLVLCFFISLSWSIFLRRWICWSSTRLW